MSVCPNAFIDNKLCAGVIHLVGKDFVPFSDPFGMLLNNKTISFLERALGQIYICDHSYISPNYKDEIQRVFYKFFKKIKR